MSFAMTESWSTGVVLVGSFLFRLVLGGELIARTGVVHNGIVIVGQGAKSLYVERHLNLEHHIEPGDPDPEVLELPVREK